MKKNKRSVNKISIAVVLLVFLAASSLSSCLKNGAYYTNFASVAASVDLPLAAYNTNWTGGPPYPFVYPDTTTYVDFPYYINLASPQTLGTAVTATLAIDTAYFNTWNAEVGGNAYTLMPDSDYVVLNGWNRTIPAGERLDSMYVQFNMINIAYQYENNGIQYILPITIASASVPIEQWDHELVNPEPQ